MTLAERNRFPIKNRWTLIPGNTRETDPRIALGMALIDPSEIRVAACQRFPTIKTRAGH